MSGRRELKPYKGQMARRLVYLCIGVLIATLLWAMILKTVDHTIDTSDILTYTGAAFGGELLLLAFKRVFSKPQENQEE